MTIREVCRRTRIIDGHVTYSYVNEAGRLVAVSEKQYREWEARAVHSDCMYSRNDKLFRRNFKTLRFA